MLNQRHYLAHFDEAEFEMLKPEILSSVLLSEVSYDVRAAMEVILSAGPLPGIVCRPSASVAQGQGQVGFSFPLKVGAQRVRSVATIHESQVSHFSSPWDVTKYALASGMVEENPALEALVNSGQELGIPIGLIGSWAMQAMTGLSYTHANSDLDIVILEQSLRKVERLECINSDISSQFHVKIDCEVVLLGKYGVKLQEYTSGSKSLLCKTISGVDLISRSAIASLN